MDLFKAFIGFILPFILGVLLMMFIGKKSGMLSSGDLDDIKKENKDLVHQNDSLTFNIMVRNKIIIERDLIIENNKQLLDHKDSLISISDTNIMRLENDIKNIEKIISVLNDEYDKINSEQSNEIDIINNFTSHEQFMYLSKLFSERRDNIK